MGGLEAQATILGHNNTDLFELKVFPLQPLVLVDTILGRFLWNAGRLVWRGRVLLGVELRGGHHDVPVNRRTHGCVSG